MATKVETTLTCDMTHALGRTPKDGVIKTIEFAVEGQSYEMEVCEQHDKAFHRDVGRFIDVARRLTVIKPTRRASSAPSVEGLTAAQERNRAIRAWAKASNVYVPDRGRIPFDTIAKYDAAGGVVLNSEPEPVKDGG